MADRARPVRVVFVCWGNICRSPMAERVARRAANQAGLSGVQFTSAATSREEIGAGIDPRAAQVLRRHGYDADGHTAHQVTADEIESADLVVAMEDIHLARMRRLVADADHLVLLTDFDPDAPAGAGVPDPWYGDEDGFFDTLATVEAAMPGLLDRVRELQGGPAPR
ncbi:MAG: low molecular weight protein-tyrosine-phosphatase [Actinomycetes bacterium]